MYKEKYETPESEMITFETEDVITTSGCDLLISGDEGDSELPLG